MKENQRNSKGLKRSDTGVTQRRSLHIKEVVVKQTKLIL